MNFVPAGNRLLVRVEQAEETRASGLIIPENAQEKPQVATVVAVGDGEIEDGIAVPLPFEEGETIVFSRYGGVEIKLDGEDFLILRHEDVLGWLEDV